MKTAILSRSFHCPKCEAKKLPKDEMLFIVYGNKTKTYHVYLTTKSAVKFEYGITPHFISAEYTDKDKEVALTVACCMENCGVVIYKNDKGKFMFDIIQARFVKIPMNEFKVLLNRSDFGFHI